MGYFLKENVRFAYVARQFLSNLSTLRKRRGREDPGREWHRCAARFPGFPDVCASAQNA